MIRKLSIRYKLMMGVLLGCLIPFLVMGVLFRDNMENWLYDKALEDSSLRLRQTARYVDDAVLENKVRLINTIASDTRIREAGEGITSYTEYDPWTFSYEPGAREREIYRFFQAINQANPMITLVSLGTEDGGYVEYPEFRPSAPYDPRVRPWYMQALKRGGVNISEPYQTSVSGDLVVSIGRPVKRGLNTVGVVSLTMRLEDIMAAVNGQKYGETGSILILSPENRFINSPESKEWLLRSPEELGLEVFRDLDGYHEDHFTAELEGRERVFGVYVSPRTGWKYVSVIDRSEVLAGSGPLAELLWAAQGVTVLLVLLLTFLMTGYISRPIVRVAGAIRRMSSFRGNPEDLSDLTAHPQSGDEIDGIVEALVDMQANYRELMASLHSVENQIQEISVDGSSLAPLALKPSNPFNEIAVSVNDLLDRVNAYTGQIKLFSEEIAHKNQLLSDSEKNLRDRLDQIRQQRDRIQYLANHDPLTDLPNRRRFRQEIDRAIRSEEEGAVVMMDLDNFKGINDTLGHVVGDRILVEFARRLEELEQPGIFVSRFGGDEFLILLSGRARQESLGVFLDELKEAGGSPIRTPDQEITVEYSVGVSRFPQDSRDVDQLLMYADLALYNAKALGKNRVSFFDESLAHQLKDRQEIRRILKKEVPGGGIQVLYQPLVNARNGSIWGYEALARLKNYNIPPCDFIPVAEEYGLVIPLGRRIMEMVVDQMGLWAQRGLSLRPVSINFSAAQISDLNFARDLAERCRQRGIDPRLITVEITENIFLENTEATLVFMEALREHGIRIAIDDFGTGYSSLSYLTFLPIDILKLDRILCERFLELENIGVMESLIHLAHALGLQVVAEGIEEYEQVSRLRRGGCDVIQGYYFSRPLTPEAVEAGYSQVFSVRGTVSDTRPGTAPAGILPDSI